MKKVERSDVSTHVEVFKKWSELANISGWKKWSEGVMARPKGYLYPNTVATLYELHGWMIGMEYRLPNFFHEFQAAFEDFRIKLGEFLLFFHDDWARSEEEGYYWLEKTSLVASLSAATIEDYIDRGYVLGPDTLAERAMHELTRAANHMIARALEDFSDYMSASQTMVKIRYLGGSYGNQGELCPELSDGEKKTVYQNWISEGRLNEILNDSRNYVKPKFLPLFHRLGRY